jgi:type IV secretion system coupling TraD/TrwB family protein
MRAGVYRAMSWRTSGASFAIWTQMAARVAAVTAMVWSTLTFVLVWYWTGYYGGVAAHRYFWLWILTWLFTDIIPLPFGSVPYRGARYTIPSMYPFLCYKYYSGGSFPGWFWHYAPWGLLITLIIFITIVWVMFRPRRDYADDRYVRGTDVIPQRRLRHQLGGDGVEIGGLRVPRTIEPQHFLFVGAPGSGKSTAIRRMLRQIEERGQTTVVLDPECEYVPEFYRPKRGDLVLNPLDGRCPIWSPWWELKPGSEAMDAEALAAALIPDPPNVFSQSGADFFFRQSARTLIVSLLQRVRSREPRDIPKLLALPRAKLKEALRGTPAEVLIDPGAHEQGAGIVATAFNATNPFRYLIGEAGRAWSALEWAQSREGWLFLTSTEDSREAALPLQSVWLDCIVRRLMAEQERREQVWIIADELPVLKRQSQLEALVVRGLKRWLCAVLGFQAITQPRAIYGQEQTATLAAAPATKLILRTGEAETARWSSAQIGEREISRTQIGTNTALREQRDSFSMHPQRLIESAVLGSEIQMLQPFEGYLCITGHHRARVTIPYIAPVKRHPGFVRRLMAEELNEQSATPIPEHNLGRPGHSAVSVAAPKRAPAGRRLRA